MFVEISAVAWIFVEKSTTTIVQYTTFDERGKILLYFIGVRVVKWSARSRFAAEKPCARKMFEKKEREGSTSIIIEHMHRTKKNVYRAKKMNDSCMSFIRSLRSLFHLCLFHFFLRLNRLSISQRVFYFLFSWK